MLTVERILDEVADNFNCDVSMIKSSMRIDRISYAKQASIYLIRKYLYQVSLDEIAELLCYKNKTSVSRANKKAFDNMDMDKDFRQKIVATERAILLVKLNLKV